MTSREAEKKRSKRAWVSIRVSEESKHEERTELLLGSADGDLHADEGGSDEDDLGSLDDG
jgi:hypothetical protein